MKMNTVPSFWTSVAWPSVMPLSNWMQDVLRRYEFIKEWVTQGKVDIVWFSGFFYPQAFITGTKQNYARKMKIPIDKLELDFDICSERP